MGIMSFITNFAETSEKHFNKSLQTHYYRTSYTKVKNKIIDYANEFDFIVNSIDDKHGEIFIQTTKFHLIMTLFQVNALETSVDVKVQTYKIFGMNKPQRVITNLFTYLDRNLEFKGIGLHS